MPRRVSAPVSRLTSHLGAVITVMTHTPPHPSLEHTMSKVELQMKVREVFILPVDGPYNVQPAQRITKDGVFS